MRRGSVLRALAAAALAAPLLGGCGGSDDASGYVKVACRDWVKERLKSPATAEFSGEAVTRAGNRYTVSGVVDSQNSFGAMVRNSYQCIATNSGESSTLIDLSGLDN